MNFSTLNTSFLKDEVIDSFSSVIWTERYSKPGDVTMVVPATPENIISLAEGKFLSLEGSKEVMTIETQSIEEGGMTITGPSLLNVLANRIFRVTQPHNSQSWYVDSYSPGELISQIVEFGVIAPFEYDGISAYPIGIGYLTNVIPELSLNLIDSSGANVVGAVPYGQILPIITSFAESYHVGMSLLLTSATVAGYELEFNTYQGTDRTSDQSTYPVVRFSPSLDSLTKIKELRSIAGYKTVAYAFATNDESGAVHAPGVAEAYAGAAAETGFNKRVLSVDVGDIDPDVFASPVQTQAILDIYARNALANNNYVKVVDGEIVPQSQFQYGVDYFLGDIIELEGYAGTIQKARVTEYIRSQDDTGERAYPTIEVIE